MELADFNAKTQALLALFPEGADQGEATNILAELTTGFSEEIAAKIFQPLHSMMYTGYIVEQNLYGDAFCGKNIPCIKDVSLSTINQLCNACTEDNSGCALVLTY